MRHNARDAFLFSLPFLLVYIGFLVYPIFYGLQLSFFDWNILSGKTFVGVSNYIDALGDEKFRSAFAHTCEFALITTPTIIIVGFLMALVVVSTSKLRRLSEAIFFIPFILSTTVVGTLWAWIFQKNYGILNKLLGVFGLHEIGWLTDPKFAMASIAIATIWWTAGFNMILFSAGMKQIPEEIYESARLDGANRLQVLGLITIPLLRDTALLVLILQIIASFKVFGQSYVMTGGGPYGRTRVLVQYVYETGFSYFKMGYASAMSIFLFVIILLVSVVQFIAFREEKK
ncbi:MAG TPA: sugar ABC transporter permease [Rectinemataceae bacterium]|nr:sugar ABC transporter permease [Rectinemataceae bacterium]